MNNKIKVDMFLSGRTIVIFLNGNTKLFNINLGHKESDITILLLSCDNSRII